VLVIASSEVVAARVEAMLRGDPGLCVAVSGLAELAHRLDDHDPTIVVLAVPPPRVARTLETLGERARVPAVVVLSTPPHDVWTPQARRAGARAVLRSDATTEELLAAITALRAGLIALHPDVVNIPPAARTMSAPGESAAPLSPREVEILEMMAEGSSNRAIAARLAISRHTVKFHVASIFAKLGAGSRTEAVTLGVRQGLIAL